MQRRIILASALALLSAPGAEAQAWCGQRVDATIQCGYSSRAECEKANPGKGAVCFINNIHDASPQASACAPQNTTGNVIYDNKKTRRMRAAGLLGKCAGVCSSGN
jgi:hypothetical protein